MSYPDWYTPSKERKAANRRVLQGLHPMGLYLREDDNTCGGCTHVHRIHKGKVYIKCDLTNYTAGPGTDIRLKWRGCEKWEAL